MRFLLLIVLSLSSYVGLSAQVATIDSKKIMETIEQVRMADTLIQQEQQRLSQEYNKLRYKTQLQLGLADSLYKVSPQDSLTQLELTIAQQMNDSLNKFEQDANKSLLSFQSVLMTPYIEKVDAAVKKVAKRLGYKQVIDIQQVPMAYIDESADITEAVIKELKKE